MAPLAQAEPADAATPSSSRSDKQGLAFDPVDHEVAVARRFFLAWGSLVSAGNAGEEPLGQPVPQPVNALAGRPPLGRRRFQGGGHADYAGDVVGAGPTFPFLRPAVDEWLQLDGAAQGQSADPLWAAKLVPADADHVGACGAFGHVEPGHGLNGVRVKDRRRRPPVDQAGHVGQGLDRTHLIVDELDRHDADGLVEHRGTGRRGRRPHHFRLRPLELATDPALRRFARRGARRGVRWH